MPRRERRKCSVCDKTGHNKRTCSVFAKQQQAIVTEQIVDAVDHTEVIDTPVPRSQKTDSPSVFVRVGSAAETSPHVVDLKDDEREMMLNQVEVFREKYTAVHGRDTVDFAKLIKQEKAEARVQREKNPAFATMATSTSLQIGPVVPTKAVSKQKKKRTWSLPAFSLPTISFPTFQIPRFQVPQFRFSAVGVGVLAIIIAIPYPALGYISDVKEDSRHIVAVSTEGFTALQASTLAALSSDIDGAANNLNTALDAFSKANDLLDTKYTWLQSVASMLPVVGKQVNGKQQLLLAGHHMALGNTYLVQGIRTAQAKESSSLSLQLSILASHMKSAAVQYEAALEAITSISDSAIPKEYRGTAAEFELLFGTFVNDMYDVIDLVDVLQLMLGTKDTATYLVMFQNHHELRPTGGFMGSYAIVTVDHGNVSWQIPEGGTYDLQGQLTLNYTPPLPLQMVNNKWEFQDANWWSHIPASAAVIEEMYANARNTNIDGVFFVNATVLEHVLDAVGPIISPDGTQEVTAESIIAYINERKVSDTADDNAPKRVIAELVPTLLDAIANGGQDTLVQLLLTLTNGLNERDIQVYTDNSKTQETLREYGWTGEVREVEQGQDYLQIVRTNVQGGKSDANIDESVSIETNIQETGVIVNTVRITRTHTNTVVGDRYDSPNVSYIRTYVPVGSKLIAAEGFEYPDESAFTVPSRFSLQHPLELRLASTAIIDRASGTHTYDEFHKTVFANWMVIPPGESRTVELTYALPFTVEMLETELSDSRYLPYTMIHQKQSGLESSVIHTVTFPSAWHVYWQSDEEIETGGNFAIYKTHYDRDRYYGIILDTE